MIPIILLYFVFEDNFFKKKIITIIFFAILFVILDVFYQFLNYDSFNGFKSIYLDTYLILQSLIG